MFFFFNDTATTEIYTYSHTLSLHDALPIYVEHVRQTFQAHHRLTPLRLQGTGALEQLFLAVEIERRKTRRASERMRRVCVAMEQFDHVLRSEEHTSEVQSLMHSSYAVFCLKKKTTNEQQRKRQIVDI